MKEFDDTTNDILRKSCKEKYAEFSDFVEPIIKIREIGIKISNKKIPKLTLQIIEFVYSKLMEFSLT